MAFSQIQNEDLFLRMVLFPFPRLLLVWEEVLCIIWPSTLLDPPQGLPWVALKPFWTSPLVTRVAPNEKSEPKGPCAVRKFNFFICSKTRGSTV
ncbi:unnamed protein product, partial [Vitis vinifera]|uniref:Uncharacterized protein n=1 Tax=Vitis vinifera TaxID=29760 RepID=D7TR50_VITVI